MEQNEKKSFAKEMGEAVKKNILDGYDWQAERELSLKNWRSWGSWFSWGSPIGLGLFLISIGIFILLLHLANLF